MSEARASRKIFSTGYSRHSPLPPKICTASLATSKAVWVQKTLDAAVAEISAASQPGRKGLAARVDVTLPGDYEKLCNQVYAEFNDCGLLLRHWLQPRLDFSLLGPRRPSAGPPRGRQAAGSCPAAGRQLSEFQGSYRKLSGSCCRQLSGSCRNLSDSCRTVFGSSRKVSGSCRR